MDHRDAGEAEFCERTHAERAAAIERRHEHAVEPFAEARAQDLAAGLEVVALVLERALVVELELALAEPVVDVPIAVLLHRHRDRRTPRPRFEVARRRLLHVDRDRAEMHGCAATFEHAPHRFEARREVAHVVEPDDHFAVHDHLACSALS